MASDLFLPTPLKKSKLDIPELPDIVFPPVFNPQLLEAASNKITELKRNNQINGSVPHASPSRLPTETSKDSKSNDLKLAIVSKRTMPKLYSRSKRYDTSVNESVRVPRLFELCIRVLAANIDAIDEVGDLPYDVLKDVLDKCNPMQLMRIESHNPHLIEDTEHLWEGFCRREFKNAELRKENDQGWCEYYVSLCEFRDKKLEQLKSKVSQHLIEAEAPKRKTKYTSVVSRPTGRDRYLAQNSPQKEQMRKRSEAKFTIDKSKTSTVSDPILKSKPVLTEAPVVIPSRAEILAKRGLKTLNDPKKFKTQTNAMEMVPPKVRLSSVVSSGSSFRNNSTAPVFNKPRVSMSNSSIEIKAEKMPKSSNGIVPLSKLSFVPNERPLSGRNETKQVGESDKVKSSSSAIPTKLKKDLKSQPNSSKKKVVRQSLFGS